MYRKVTYIKREQADTILTEGGSQGRISIAGIPIPKSWRSAHTIITIVFQATRRAKIRLQLFIISSEHHSPLNPEDRTTKQTLLQLHNHYHRELPLKEFFYCSSWLLIYGFSIWTERKILDLIVHWNRSRAFVLFYTHFSLQFVTKALKWLFEKGRNRRCQFCEQTKAPASLLHFYY